MFDRLPQGLPRTARGAYLLLSRGRLLCVLAGLLTFASIASAEQLDEMSLERWKELREVERYQLQIAEQYYREKNWKVAQGEYEKYLTLYERSEAAPHAQLKWSLCLVQLRKLNTAVKEGFQSVIDYWPESDDATAAAYYIGKAYKDMGEVKQAKQAYRTVLSKHPKHLAAVYAMTDLIDITQVENDVDARVALWKTLAFETERTKESRNLCVSASQQLAAHLFTAGAAAEGVKALATTYPEEQLPYYTLYFARGPISTLTGDEGSKLKGEKVADDLIAFVREKVPADVADPERKKVAVQYWYFIADLHAAARRDEKVLETYKQMEATYGVQDELLGRLAGWFKSKGKYDEARQAYSRYENKAEGQNQIAYSFREQKQYDPAIAAYHQALALDSEKSVRWKSEIALTYRHAGKPNEAVATYTELLKEDAANTGRWLWEIAITYRDFNQFPEAIGYFRQCENFPENYKQMAYCNRQLKKYDEAVLLYNQVVGGDKNSAPWALLQIGYTREQAGQTELAIKAFQQVCKQFPKDGHASQAHAHLQDKYKISVTLGGATDE